jgi:antitoxin (DNA-binding transcriptional repressor) of toxin-antitoxin stability system
MLPTTMMVELSEARERMQDVVDAVMQGREIVVTHLGEPLAMLVLHGTPGGAPRAWLEGVVREGFDTVAQRLCDPERLPSWILN